jgi:hypothetical protein
VHDVLPYAARAHGEHKAYGVRDIIDIVEEQKEVTKIVGGEEVKGTKTWKYFQLSEYKYLSFTEFKPGVSEVSRRLFKLDLQKNEVFNIYAQTVSDSFSLYPFSSSFHPISPPPLSDVIPSQRGMVDMPHELPVPFSKTPSLPPR